SSPAPPCASDADCRNDELCNHECTPLWSKAGPPGPGRMVLEELQMPAGIAVSDRAIIWWYGGAPASVWEQPLAGGSERTIDSGKIWPSDVAFDDDGTAYEASVAYPSGETEITRGEIRKLGDAPARAVALASDLDNSASLAVHSGIVYYANNLIPVPQSSTIA